MVTATSLAAADQLGSLLQARAVIERRRWRAYATARLIPVHALHDLPLEPLRAELVSEIGIACPEPLRPVLAALLERELAAARPRVDIVARLVDARWHRDYAAAALAGMEAALRAEAHEAIAELPELVPKALRPRLRTLALDGAIARHGKHGAWSRFHGNLSRPGSEAAFPPTPSLVHALVELAIARHAADRLAGAERVAHRLGSLDRRRALAHVARAVFVLAGARAAERRLLALPDDGVRDAGWYLVAREAVRVADEAAAVRFAARIANPYLAHRLRIARARLALRRGAPIDARRVLGSSPHAALAFDHWYCRMAIALRLRAPERARAHRPAGQPAGWTAPAWLLEHDVAPATRAKLVQIAALVRTDDDGCRRAAGELTHVVRDPAARGEALVLFDEIGLDGFDAIARLREHAAPERRQPSDVLFAAWIAHRAAEIARAGNALPSPMRAGIAGARPPRALDDGSGGASLERALFDEGSLHAAPRRLGILTAARASLRGLVERPAAAVPALVDCRIRTLGQLGGERARDVLEDCLARRPAARYVVRLIEALCWVDRDAAARAAIGHATSSSGDDTGALQVLRLVETYRGLPCGFARAWGAAVAALGRASGPARARAFLAELIADRGIPALELLAWVTARAAEQRLDEARTVLASAEARCAALTRAWPHEAARRLARDPALRETLQLLRGLRVVTRARPWSSAEWTRVLEDAASPHTGAVDLGVVRRCARLLRCDPHPLSAGDLVALGARAEHVLDGGLRVRLLAKRADLLEYLRFADVPLLNCYRTDHAYYGSRQHHLIAVWKDPLSMCFRIERPDRRPFGFVFGNFVEIAGDRAGVALNGLYVERQQLATRIGVLRAIEHMLAPLGELEVGTGNQFGGTGPLPADYRRRWVHATRLRALHVGDRLVTDADDDISSEVNLPSLLGLWWKQRA